MAIAASLILINGALSLALRLGLERQFAVGRRAHRGATAGDRLPAGLGVRIRLLVRGAATDVRDDADRRAVGCRARAAHHVGNGSASVPVWGSSAKVTAVVCLR